MNVLHPTAIAVAAVLAARAELQAQAATGNENTSSVNSTISGKLKSRDQRNGIGAFLDSTILPRLAFTDASVRECLEFVFGHPELRRFDPTNEAPINFVYVGDNNERITIDISHVPLRDVFHYLCMLGGFTYEVERNTVIFTQGSVPTEFDASTESNPEIERALDKFVVDRLNFKEASIYQATSFLRNLLLTKNPKNKEVNIVVARNVGQPVITLNLSNVTLREALRYTCMVAKLNYRVERSAVFIGPKDDPYFAQGEM